MSFEWETLQCLDRHGNNVYNTSENSFYECLDMIPDSILDETNDTVHQPRRTDSGLYLPCHNSLNQSNDSKSSHQSDKIFSYSQVSSTNSTQQFYNNCLSDSFKEDDQFIESLLFDTTPHNNIMATAIQENGMKPLTNKPLNHVDNINHVEHVNNVDNADSTTDDKDLCNGQIESYVNPEIVAEAEASEVAEEPALDIVINNVVCSFSVRCHLNLREIAQRGSNVEYRRENAMITMKLRRPYTTASIWSSGKVTCTGATSEDQAKIAARKFARSLQKLGYEVRFSNYRVVNVLGTCCMPFAIKITAFSVSHKENADYEPELHPGVTYKLKEPKATLKIFSTGSVTVTAPNVAAVQAAIEHIYPLVYEFRKERTLEDELTIKKRKLSKKGQDEFLDDEPDVAYESIISDVDEDVDSDASWD